MKEKNGEAQEKMARWHQGGHERVHDVRRHGAESKCATHEDKGGPITTWMRHVGERR